MRCEDGNWDMGQEAGPAIQVCVMGELRVGWRSGVVRSGQRLSFKEFVVYVF